MKEELTYSESLRIINQMIEEAKCNYEQSGSYYFLLWGWVVASANLAFYLLDRFTDFPYPFAVWLVALPAMVLTINHSVRRQGEAKSSTHLSRLYGEVWIAVGICVVLSLLFMSKIGFNHTPVIMMIAGIGTYMTGKMLRFRPLLFGAGALWVTSVICFYLPITDQYLAASIGMIAGYLIPGYLLKSREK